MIRETELMHHGTKGMRWGIRRYQNKDGSLTYAGKKRALKMRNQYTQFSKNEKFRDKEGNLTYKGRKKDLKMKEEYSELTGKKLTKFQNKGDMSDSKTAVDNTPKQKHKQISEMTNQELRDIITRHDLELEFRTKIMPEKKSLGKKWADTLRDKTADKIMEKGAAIAADYVDKKIRDKIGLPKEKKKK